MLLPVAFVLGALFGWHRASRRGGDRLDKLQYGAAHGILLRAGHPGGDHPRAAPRARSDVRGRFSLSCARRGCRCRCASTSAFLEGLDAGLARFDAEGFYYLARASLVKDERHIDRFDRVFAATFNGLEPLTVEALVARLDLPEDWLRKLVEKHLTPEEHAEIEALGGFEKLMRALADRLAPSRRAGIRAGRSGSAPPAPRRSGPTATIPRVCESARTRAGTGGRSRSGTGASSGTSTTRSSSAPATSRWRCAGCVAGRARARRTSSTSAATIRRTAEQGWLDVVTRPERRNAIKVLLFLDIGGSMDPHVRVVEELFSAARAEFKHLEWFYFHNCLYEAVWRDNRRRWDRQTPTEEVLRTFGPDYRVIFVGDAAMSPYEIVQPGGASEHWNAESGETWLRRLLDDLAARDLDQPDAGGQAGATPSRSR